METSPQPALAPVVPTPYVEDNDASYGALWRLHLLRLLRRRRRWMLGKSLTLRKNTLTNDEVRELLRRYPVEQTETTDVLYRMGEFLLRENLERTAFLDGKATALLGYLGALLAFIVSQLPKWGPTTSWEVRTFLVVAGVGALASLACAAPIVYRRRWTWFGDRAWLRQELLAAPEMMRRHYVARMHLVNADHGEHNAAKGIWLARAHLAGVVAGAALAAAVLTHLVLLAT